MSIHRSCGWLAAACVLLCVSTPAHAALRPDTPYGVHSMVYANAPSSFKEAMFREAAAVGASSVRVDVSVGAIAMSGTERNWGSLDEYLALARRYRLQVVGVLVGTPWWLAKCPPGTLDYYKCPVTDAQGRSTAARGWKPC